MLALPGIAILAAAIGGCSGGTTVLTPQASSAPTHAPTHAPTTAPTTVPTATPTATPTTAPTNTPSPSPSPTSSSSAIVLNPTSVVVGPVGSGCTQTAQFVASEAGYNGSFSAVSNNTSVVTVTPTQAPGGSFTVTSATSQSQQSTTITVSDTLGHTASEPATIAICLP